MMNIYQEIFDKVYTHLEQQGGASALETGACLYRSEDGKMCAVGCLIPDDKYDPKFEGEPVDELIYAPDGWKPEWFTGDKHSDDIVSFLWKLQEAHDADLRSSGLDSWRYRMIEIAEEYELSVEVIVNGQQ